MRIEKKKKGINILLLSSLEMKTHVQCIHMYVTQTRVSVLVRCERIKLWECVEKYAYTHRLRFRVSIGFYVVAKQKQFEILCIHHVKHRYR